MRVDSRELLDVVEPDAFIDLMHGFADQTKFNYPRGIFDKAGVGCAAACRQFGLFAGH